MSQANRSNLTISFSSFEEPGYGTNGLYPHWTPDSRTVGDSVPSPTASVQTAWTVPLPRQTNFVNFQHPNATRRNERIGPSLQNLSFLVPSGSRSPSTLPSQADPITRFYHDAPPWSTHSMRNTGRNAYSDANGFLGPCRDGPKSDIDSVAPKSDSGYHTQLSQSLSSNEPGYVDRDLPGEVLRVGNLKVRSTPSEASPMVRMHSDQISHVSSRSGRSGSKGQQLQCSDCEEVSKCNSDFKKHILKHKKPFKCEEPNCKRNGQGFTTVNDLDRHKKSVHRIGLQTKSYRCASDTCRNKEKLWPRLDNFKQHIERMHKEEDELDLIKRSMLHPADQASVIESNTVAPMDTSLAVAGMEKPFSDNPVMHSVPVMDLPMDQDPGHWPSLSTDTNDLMTDAYRMSSQFNEFDEVNNSTGSQGSKGSPYVYQRASGKIARRESHTVLDDEATQIVSKQPAPEIHQQKPRPSLSNAPQTKVEQQRSALQKLSRAVNMEIKSSSDTVDLEELVLRILHRTTDSAKWDGRSPYQHQDAQEPQDRTTPVTLTKGEALKASQMISNLIKQSPGSAYTIQRRPTQGFISNAKACPKCDYTVARDCDLRKHMKRHEKPYGCTYPKCHKRFGAKSDWKRHENSQHFQLEAFRCAQETFAGITCGQHFWRAESFKTHLETQHKMPSPEEQECEAKRSKIGKNCQVQFWCGFCSKVTKLNEKRNAAWDERFDHIAQHFEKDKRSIDEWICAEENKTKKELLKEVDRYVFDDEEEREDVDAAGDVDDDPLPPLDRPEQIQTRLNAGSPLPQAFPHTNSRKRQASTDAPAPRRQSKQRRTTTQMNYKYCCSCSSGPWSPHMYAACIDCSHQFCSSCISHDEDVNGTTL